jgi:hypothetical protein
MLSIISIYVPQCRKLKIASQCLIQRTTTGLIRGSTHSLLRQDSLQFLRIPRLLMMLLLKKASYKLKLELRDLLIVVLLPIRY